MDKADKSKRYIFKREDFACPCCGLNLVVSELPPVLDDLWENSGPFVISSGTRCKKHNASLKPKPGGKRSRHLTGEGADLVFARYSDSREALAYLYGKYPDTYGIGSYSWGLHIDVRSKKARW